MLTKNDLKAIKTIVQAEIDPLQGDMRVIGEDIKVIKEQIKPIKSMQSSIRKIKKDVKVLIDHFDRRDVRLQKRVGRIEEHVGLPPLPKN